MAYKYNDYTGQLFGKLTVIEQAGRNKHRRILWRCKCDCGNECVVDSMALKKKQSSCGCYRHAAIRKDRTGERHGRLFVLGPAHIKRRTENYWTCLCDCGTICTVPGTSLKKGDAKSCGCLKLDLVKERATIHGQSKTILYKRWNSIRNRCNNESYKRYKDYGGRGIKMCDEWSDFEVFAKWENENGYEEHLTIDRIDNNGNYCPENCRWVPMSVQAWNKRTTTKVTYNGETLNLHEWSERTGLPHTTIRSRLDRGWSVEDTLTVPWLERTERKKWKASR